ncbi:glycosyltransferase family 2 protein [Roseinatronobacter alkalisoli]|uniref:Glycosyltransferase family 2 protein n=1 Tax=Roseinatronobacter alkalisoli TaxID=3028235 RepID=A0ABT5T5U8_9RHOB|nr:glycosyltransferase family 2 protein [Roseinatronobacter sp. HJB301]MDD7970468.1 glycosyltransferase family 2 protein [Roseinatronobacter sp. HJB301]
MRWKRRRLRARAVGKARDLTALKRGTWARSDILLFCTIRNERERIDWFLHHYRRLGVGHFLFVDNDSTDGTRQLLLDQPDTSVWGSAASYKQSRFGMDWINALMLRYGSGQWCVVADADELLIYPHWDTRPLPALTDWLECQGQAIMPAMMLEMYPKGPLAAQTCPPGTDPIAVLNWFDAGNYSILHKPLLDALLIQGGPRARTFFKDTPNRAPTLTKLPLIKWSWHNTWVNSTHSILPRALNRFYDRTGGEGIAGALLHTKFLHSVVEKAPVEKARGQHFGNAPVFDSYYDAVATSPDLWCETSTRFEGWQQLEQLGLISRGGWA